MKKLHDMRNLLVLLITSTLLYSFGKIHAPAGSASGNYAVSGYTQHRDTLPPSSNMLPGNISKEEFQQKALSKIKEFQGCLYILCDKKSGNIAQDNAVDQATRLFIDGAIIEVTSVNSDDKKHLKVRDFLEKLRNLRYERIEITFSHVDYVSSIHKGADNKYYGLVSFEQTFRAFSDGRLVYQDETKKTTEVQLVVYDRHLRGNAIQQWDVMLSDVEVLGTKTPKS